MIEWNTIALEQLVEEITVGFVGPMASEYIEHGIPFLRSQNVVPFSINYEGIKYISEVFHNKLSKSALKPGDVVIVRTGKPGASAVIPESLIIANCSDLVIVRCGDKLDPKFISYFINSITKSHVEANLVGAVQQHFNVGSAKKILVPDIDIYQQKLIANVLSSLDDKIDLLHRQNATLEAMAETLFRQWFVEEAKEDWGLAKLEDFVFCYNGVSYKSEDLNPSRTALVTLKSFERTGGFRIDGFKEFTGTYKEQHIVKVGDLIVAHTDITQEADVIGNPVLVESDPKYDVLVFSMDLVKVVPRNTKLTIEFLYFLMKSKIFKDHCLGNSNGSTVLHLSKRAIPTFEFLLPPHDKISEFTKEVKSLINKKCTNQNQIRTLTSLRDTLLPKLMNGEVRIEI